MKKILGLFIILLIFNTISGQSLNHAITNSHVDSVWQGINLPQGYTGKGVIVGITDWGFDYTHPVFFDTTLTYSRILRVWDMFRNNGTPPEGFNYGVEYTDSNEILQALCDTFNVYEYGYHGTHVASIAAGSGAKTKYRGVAFEADLLFATFIVDEQSVIDAFLWMYQVAQKENKRLVINMSWGLYYMDNLDGTGKLAKIMDSLSTLGVVFVTSGGNNGDVNFHIGQNFTTNKDTLRTQIQYDDRNANTYWGQSISMTNSPKSSFQFQIHLLDINNNIIYIDKSYNTINGNQNIDTTIIINEDTLIYRIAIESENPDNHRPQVRLRVKKTTSTYKLCLYIHADNGEFHAWNVAELENNVGNWGNDFINPYKNDTLWTAGDVYHGLGAPANVECAITVAAYNPSRPIPLGTRGGEIASFSSYGGTIDGRIKPEIAAPGQEIVGALSSYTTRYSSSIRTTKVNFRNREYGFVPLSGTSMSSPVVAGIVALILQANPNLTPQEIKNIITETAQNDQYTQTAGVERFGYGKINAYAAVQKALETLTISNNNADTHFLIYPNPTKNIINIQNTNYQQIKNIEIYNISGQLIKTTIINKSFTQIDISELPSGIYILKINDLHIKKIIKF